MDEQTRTSRALHLEEELVRARMIQNMLLPSAVPAINGAKLGYLYEPAYVLSGDFLDFYYRRKTLELGFFICDVSGHGIHAAIVAAMTKMALHLWGDYLNEPKGTLQKIARQLKGKVGDEYLTAIMGYVDLRTGLLRIARAGHPPCFIKRAASGIVERIHPDGAIIHEAVPDLMEEFETTLKQGDLLFLYTDGLTEFTGADGASMGEEGVQRMLNAALDVSSPADFCQQVYNVNVKGKVTEKAPMLDDVTLLAINFRGAGNS